MVGLFGYPQRAYAARRPTVMRQVSSSVRDILSYFTDREAHRGVERQVAPSPHAHQVRNERSGEVSELVLDRPTGGKPRGEVGAGTGDRVVVRAPQCVAGFKSRRKWRGLNRSRRRGPGSDTSCMKRENVKSVERGSVGGPGHSCPRSPSRSHAPTSSNGAAGGAGYRRIYILWTIASISVSLNARSVWLRALPAPAMLSSPAIIACSSGASTTATRS